MEDFLGLSTLESKKYVFLIVINFLKFRNSIFKQAAYRQIEVLDEMHVVRTTAISIQENKKRENFFNKYVPMHIS